MRSRGPTKALTTGKVSHELTAGTYPALNLAPFGRWTLRDNAVHLYFGEQTAAAAVQFRVWDEEQAIKTAIELPVIEEWRKRGYLILSSMREELRK